MALNSDFAILTVVFLGKPDLNVSKSSSTAACRIFVPDIPTVPSASGSLFPDETTRKLSNSKLLLLSLCFMYLPTCLCISSILSVTKFVNRLNKFRGVHIPCPDAPEIKVKKTEFERPGLKNDKISRKTSIFDVLASKLEVFELVGHGKSTRNVAEKLFISVKTVETHQAHIKRKMGLANHSELMRSAFAWVNEIRPS